MTIQMVIALAVTMLMCVLFLWGKLPFGLVTMPCVLILIMTRVLTIQEGFSGFVTPNVILVASMFGMMGAFQKVDLAKRLQGLLKNLSNKSGMTLMVMIVAIYLVATTILPAELVVLMLLSILVLLPKENQLTPSRLILPLMMLGSCWSFAVPVGAGATMDAMFNIFVQGIVTDSAQLYVLGDTFRLRLIPVIVAVIYSFIVWRWIPDTEVQLDSVTSPGEARYSLKKWQEYLVYALFWAVIVVMFFGSSLGQNIMFAFPAVCVCIFGITGILSPKELIMGVASDVTWMLAGILGVTAALTKTGAAAMLGNLLLPLISWTDNTFIILLIVCAFTGFMTNFLSNTGTAGILCPLVASMAIAAGMDPRSLVSCVTVSACYSFCLPSGSNSTAFFYTLGKYNPIKSLKYTLPLWVLLIVATAFSVNLIFPPFGQ